MSRTPTAEATPASDRLARWFVRLVTVACCVAAVWQVVKQGTAAVPAQDEWEVLGKYTDTGFGEWLFQHHNEHRYPLGRLVWMGTLRACGFDFRGPMFVSVGLLTASAVLLQWAARRLRGYTHPLDAITAVLLLHFGHAFNLIMGYQVVFTLFAYGLAGWVWCGVNWGATGRERWAWASAAYAVSLIFAGGFGVVASPAVVGWLGYLGVVAARQRRWLSAGAFAVVAAGVIGYSGWVNKTLPESNTERLHPVKQADRWMTAAGDYLGGAIGNWGPDLEGGWGRVLATTAVVAVTLAALGAAGWWAVRGSPGRRTAGVVLLAVVFVTVGSALAVGLARPTMALGDRFTTPSAAGLAVAVVAVTAGVGPARLVVRRRRTPFRLVVVVATARRRSRWATAVSAAGVIGLAVGVESLTLPRAEALGYLFSKSLDELTADLKAGAPPTVLAGRHGGGFGVLVGNYLLDALPKFKRAGFGVFAGMADDPPFTPVPVPVSLPEPSAERGFDLRLPQPPPGAFAVRIQIAAGQADGWQQLTCNWTDPTTGEPGSSIAYPHRLGWASHLVFTFDGRPTGLHIEGNNGRLRVDWVQWLVNPTPETPP